jgi:uncharacterized iron-regulated protein
LGESVKRQLRLFVVFFSAVASIVSSPAQGCDRPLRPYEILEDFGQDIGKWQSGDHPLLGRIWSRAPAGLIDEPSLHWATEGRGSCDEPGYSKLIDAIYKAQVVLLGEIHDNKKHHDIRADLLIAPKSAAARDDYPWPLFGVVFEQLRSDQQDALDSFVETVKAPPHSLSMDDFSRALDWQKTGWAQYGYDRLFQAAIDAKLPIYAGDVTRDAIMKVAKEGETALPAEERARLKLDVPLGPTLDDASLSEIEEAHCGTMPKEAFTGMAYAQRYRDATLADNVLKAADKHGSAILIAGNGHVRTDRGVPWYIHQRAPDKKVVSVMLIEVEDGKNDPEAYVPRDPDGKPAADYIIFTPRAERGDPCEKMRAGKGK